MKTQTCFCTALSKVAFVLAVTVGLLGTDSTTARADEWHDHERQAHDWHERHRHHHHERLEVIEQPNVVYAPPVVVEAPPSTDDSEPSGINIVFPINIH